MFKGTSYDALRTSRSGQRGLLAHLPRVARIVLDIIRVVQRSKKRP